MADNWNVSFSGFLERKNLMGWQLRWVVIEKNKLMIFTDETENVLKENYNVTPECTVEVGGTSGSRSHTFHLFDASISKTTYFFATQDAAALEAWVLALIQTINGTYRESENFCRSFSQSGSMVFPSNQDLNAHFGEICAHAVDVMESQLMYDTGKMGSLVTQEYGQLGLLHSWKRRWISLNQHTLRIYTSNSAPEEGSTGELKYETLLEADSRVCVLPTGYESQPFAFSIVTTNPGGDHSALRLSTDDQDSLFSWISVLQNAIQHRHASTHELEDMSHEEGGGVCDGGDEHGDEVRRGGSKLSAATASTFYINDDTVWAQLRQSVFTRDPGRHHVNNDQLQEVYLTFFCTNIPNSHSLLVEVYESQRYLPLQGWNPLHLLPTDCAKLSSIDGVKYPDRYLRRAAAPSGYEWMPEDDTGDEAAAAAKDCTVHGKWSIDCSHHDAGEGGWCYATSFGSMRKRYADNTTHSTPHATDVVKQRRWLRVARPAVRTTSIDQECDSTGVTDEDAEGTITSVVDDTDHKAVNRDKEDIAVSDGVQHHGLDG